MFKAIFNFFSLNSSNSTPTVLFDYKKFPVLYLSRCKSVIEQMINCELIKRLSVCESVEGFGCPERFSSYDLVDVMFSKSMLQKLCDNSDQINVKTDDELKQIVKIVMKKYLMEKPSKEPKSKVSIEVLVPNSRKIQVVSYANENNDGTPKLKDPGGTIEHWETPLQAGIREIKEELGIIVNNLEFVEQKDKLYKYRLVLNEIEFEDYIKQVNTLDIDPEITMIAVCQV
jgi:hypothetical protein